MKIEEQAVLLGMSERHGVFVKDIKGYQMQLTTRQNMNGIGKIPCISFVFDREIERQEKQQIMKAQGMLKGYVFFESVGLKDNAVFIYVNATKRNIDKTNAKIDKFIDVFVQSKLKTLTGCPFCESDELTDGHRIVKGALINVHESCVETYVKKVESKIDEHEQSKGMGISLVYGMLGAIFGAVPAMVALIGFGYFVGLLFFLIPFVSFTFYKFGKGPKTKLPLVILGLFSLILVPIIVVYLYHLTAAVEGYTLIEALDLYPEFASEFYYNLGMSFLFSFIGIIISWSYIYKQSTSSTKKRLNEYRS